MRDKIKYQLLDANSGTHSKYLNSGKYKIRSFLFILILFIVALILYNQFINSGRLKSGSFNSKTSLPYEAVVEELRKEIDEQNTFMRGIRNYFEDLKIIPPLKPSYRHRPETAHVDCGRILKGDTDYIKEIGEINRIKIVENQNLNMSCSAIMDRINPHELLLKPLSAGVAFARIVYTDYEMIEDQVRASFHPRNIFCFAIDRKSDENFHKRMKVLASCLPNILLVPDEDPIDSSGHNINSAHYNCMKALVNKPGWNYLLLLQNHDVITKSIYELVRIYELLNGANDVEITPDVGRADHSLKWDPISLNLFRNQTGIPTNVLKQNMKFAKGAVQGSLSRDAVDWMVRTVDLSTFIRQMNKGSFGIDELFIQSFQINEFLQMPGHFTDKCLQQKQNTDFISRMSQWEFSNPNRCATKQIRHSICLLGIEDLRTIAAFPNIMFNKMIPSFDYSVVECTGELLFNRTYLGQDDHPLEESYYENMVNVLYHKNRNNSNYEVQCTPTYTPWSKRKYPV